MAALRRSDINIRKMVYLAVLTAIVFLLQFIALYMRFATFSLTFVLVPIVIGSAICGKWSGAWLGFVFGLAVFITNDAAFFLGFDVFGTIVTVMLKGILAGLLSGLVYSAHKKDSFVAVLAAAITAPIVNTGVFVLGCYAFFYDDIVSLAGSENILPYIIVSFVGINFLIELGTNIVLSPTIMRIIKIKKKA